VLNVVAAPWSGLGRGHRHLAQSGTWWRGWRTANASNPIQGLNVVVLSQASIPSSFERAVICSRCHPRESEDPAPRPNLALARLEEPALPTAGPVLRIRLLERLRFLG